MFKMAAGVCIVSLALVMGGCGLSEKSTDVLATVGTQKLTIADLDRFLLSLAEDQRWAPAGSDHEAWVEDKIRRLALEKYLLNSPSMAELVNDPKMEAHKQLFRFQRLNQLLREALFRDIQPSEEAIHDKLLAAKQPMDQQPVIDFQHIFFRTDRGDSATIRATAEAVAKRAKAGEDFSHLAKTHSHSANAKEGGLVRNVHLSNLDEKTKSILAALAEGEVSSLVESRTGLHIFRLIRRVQREQPSAAQQKAAAVGTIRQETFTAEYQSLLQTLRQTVAMQIDQEIWQIGGFTIESYVRDYFLKSKSQGDEQANQQLIDLVLLAHEALERQLATEDFEAQIEHALKLERMQRLFNQGFQDLEELLPKSRLKPYFEAQPALFAKSEQVRVRLIFVPQGRDSFSTQKQLEARVQELRGGASFAEMAQQLSTGPGAAQGGDLGLMVVGDVQKFGPNVAEAIPGLKVGDISEPIYCTDKILSRSATLLRGGFAILKLEERIPQQPRTLDEAIEDVRKAYLVQYRADLDLEVRDRMLAKADFAILRIPEPVELVQ